MTGRFAFQGLPSTSHEARLYRIRRFSDQHHAQHSRQRTHRRFAVPQNAEPPTEQPVVKRGMDVSGRIAGDCEQVTLGQRD